LLQEEARRAEALVQAAEEEALELERRLEQELEQVTREVDARLEAERNARLAFVEDEARRALLAVQALTPEQIETLADWAVDQVIQSIDGAPA
jgi:hypothetical protein